MLYFSGEDHLDTARAYYGLGCALKHLGCTEKALEKLIKAQEILNHVHASDHDTERTEQEINALRGSAKIELSCQKLQQVHIENYGVSCHGVC